MKNKLIILIILAFQVLLSQIAVFKSPYLTDELRSSTKELLKFDKVAITIKDKDKVERLKKQVSFYRAISEAIYIELNILNNKNEKKIEKFEDLISQYKEKIGNNINDMELIEPPEITYDYKPMKITSKAVKKQNHKKQAMLMKKNYILMFKYYKQMSTSYTEYLQYLKELKESGQYKVKEAVYSDTKNSNTSTNKPVDLISTSNTNLINSDNDISKKTGDSGANTIIEKKLPKVNSEQLEQLNEKLTYRIESLEVRIDEMEEDDNKKSEGINTKVDKIENKIKSLEKIDNQVKVAIDELGKNINDYSDRDYPDAFIDAKNNGITQFTYRGKKIYAFTRKEYKDAIIDARIYGKESFKLGDQHYDSKFEYEQIKRISK